MTLLEKAKSREASRSSSTVTADEIELAIGFMRGEITFSQAAFALNKNSTAGAYSQICIALRAAYQRGKLKVA